MSSWGKNRNNIQETIKNYVDFWAKEFFTGYNPPYWHEKYWFEVSPNWRFAEHEQVTSKEDLQTIVNEIHKYWKKVMWNMNAWYYVWEVEKEVEQIIQDMLDVWIDWIICWSIGILEYLDSIATWRYDGGYIINGKEIQINISTILAIYNKDAINFLLESYPIKKIILSREVTLKEIEELTSEFPNLTFETFFAWDFCRYNNWLCFAEHKYTERDICTVVLNDLIIKKSINYDFRKIIKNESLDNNQKIEKFNNEYIDDFNKLDNLLEEYELLNEGFIKENENNNTITTQKKEILENLNKLTKFIINKYILYFDTLENPNSKNNKWIKNLFIALWILKENNYSIDDDFFSYIKEELSFWYKEYSKQLKEKLGAQYGVLAEFKDKLYNRNDDLDLFTAIFFDKIENIDTIKFPTRWRNHISILEKIKEVIDWEKEVIDFINLSNSYKRSHYDLKYLFRDNKKWFYNIRKDLHLKNN